MTDSKALRNKIAAQGLKLKYVAEYIGLSPYGFQLKVDNEREFKISEVSALCELLHIEAGAEKESIFFASEGDLKSSTA